MNNDRRIESLGEHQLSTAVAATSRAFWPDPMFGFFARNDVDEHRMFPLFVHGLISDSLKHGHVDVVHHNDRVVATASWLAPGDTPRSWQREARISLLAARALIRGRNRIKGLRLLHDMDQRHPTEPHWYLALFGVDPAFQGSGIGSQMLLHRLEMCDATGVPAYLETQKPENVPFYGRFGFVVRDVIEHSGCPPLWTMWREPSTATT